MFRLILKMAWKNSFLRRSRTLLVITMIAVSMSMMLGIQGLYDGMTLNMLDKNKRSDSGDVSLYAKNYRIDKEIKNSIKDAVLIRGALEQMEGVRSVTLRLRAEGLVSTARKSSFSSMVGIELKDEEVFGKFSEFLKEGEVDLQKRGAVVGIELAKRLKLRIGSKIIFSTQDSSDEINSISLKVRGIVQTTNIFLDNSAVYIDKQAMHKFLGMDANEATQIAIMGEDEVLYETLRSKYSDFDVKNFFQLQPMMQQMQDLMAIFNSITFAIVMSVVFVGIFGVMYVSILDRIREFGIMIGIGMHYKYIRRQIFLESIFIGVIGYLCGSTLGLFLLVYIKEFGLDFSAFSDALQMWGYESIIYGTIKVSYFTTTFLAIMSASVLSVLIPLRKIKRLNPIEVIKADK